VDYNQTLWDNDKGSCHISGCPKFASLVVMTNISCIVFHLIATCFFQVHPYLSFVIVRHSMLFIMCNVNLMHPVVSENKRRQIDNHQTHSFIKIRSHMFRPSKGHLQADIWNILGSIQIMCGMEISLLAGFCYKSGLYI